jgi:hypothetical protein
MVYGVAYESYGIEAFVGLIKVSRVTAVKIRLLLVEELQLVVLHLKSILIDR